MTDPVNVQVTLLLQYIRCDPREAVKSESLRNLNLLATEAPHLWTEKDVSALCEVRIIVLGIRCMTFPCSFNKLEKSVDSFQYD